MAPVRSLQQMRKQWDAGPGGTTNAGSSLGEGQEEQKKLEAERPASPTKGEPSPVRAVEWWTQEGEAAPDTDPEPVTNVRGGATEAIQEGPWGPCPHLAMSLWPSFRGRWKLGRKDSMWDLWLPRQDKETLQERMTLQDFKAHFMPLVICKLPPGLLSQEMGQKWATPWRVLLSDDTCQLMLIRYGGPNLRKDLVSFVHLVLSVESREDGKDIYLQKPEDMGGKSRSGTGCTGRRANGMWDYWTWSGGGARNQPSGAKTGEVREPRRLDCPQVPPKEAKQTRAQAVK
ncbi:Calpain-14 [Manis pentadactyla]|nr:Calpain-14 [Manis pentadactyla]